FLCAERDTEGMPTNYNVYDRDYTTNHHPDGKKVVSTGHNHGNLHLDPNNNPSGPGWIAASEQTAPPSQGPIDTDLLGETLVSSQAGSITEADIAWFTHFENTFPACMRIPWDYTCPCVGCGKNKLPGANFDYYSVILHELGHLLGLSHFQHGNPNCQN